jgi:hypothetical protein
MRITLHAVTNYFEFSSKYKYIDLEMSHIIEYVLNYTFPPYVSLNEMKSQIYYT